jgi:sugar phosphate isomerase/epimerase
MTPEVYLSTTFAPDHSRIGEILRLCERHGLSHVEIGSNHLYERDPFGAVRQFGFEYLVHNYFPVPERRIVVNIASSNDDLRQRSLHHLFQAIDFCSAIGARLYTFHPGFLTDPKGENPNSSNYDFQFEDQSLENRDRSRALERIIAGVEQAVHHARKRGVAIAVETGGAVSRRDHLLLQRPEEYQILFGHFKPGEIGINLNLGHLRLAASACGFAIKDFIEVVSPYVVALEMSHNEGVHDEHRPLLPGQWYWGIITDPRFALAYKILELRDSSVETILENLSLVRAYLEEEVGAGHQLTLGH